MVIRNNQLLISVISLTKIVLLLCKEKGSGREASSAKYPPLPPPSSGTWWGSFLALDGHFLGKGVHLKGAKKLKKFIDDELIPTHIHKPPKMLFVILVKENPA